MANVITTKRFHVNQLFELLGGDESDLSTTPKVVGTETRIEQQQTGTTTDEDGNEVPVYEDVAVEYPIYEGIPLDSDLEKEIVVTVKGDGVTAMTQAELDTLVANYTYDPNYGKEPEEVTVQDEVTTGLQALDDATATKATWDALTVEQRQETTRLAIQAFVKVVRFIAKRFLD